MGWLDQPWMNQDSSAMRNVQNGDNPFPSAPFTFSFPTSFDMFEIQSGGENGGMHSAHEKNPSAGGQDTVSFPRSSVSFDPSSFGAPPSPSDYANTGDSGPLLGGLPHSYDGGSNFTQMMNLYGAGGMDSSAGMDPFMAYNTTVDPTQILGGTPDAGGVDQSRTFEPSPQSQGWASGSTPSSTASPEPTYASSAPTGSSMRNLVGNMGLSGSSSQSSRVVRRISNAKRLSQDLTTIRMKEEGSQGDARMAPGGSSTVIALPNSTRGSQGTGSSGTPASGAGEEAGESAVTQCTNCKTTNTPLWRRDPDGNPLCKFLSLILAAALPY